jgi:type IV pilus assembly protein PilA
MHSLNEKGFSLVEVLVVILIIGVLAAIAIPSFVSQKDKAGDAAAKSYVRTLRTAEEAQLSDSGAYTNDLNKLKAIEPTLADRPDGTTDPTLTVSGSPADAFTIAVKAASGVTYSLARTSSGAVTRSCDKPGTGSCNAGGSW